MRDILRQDGPYHRSTPIYPSPADCEIIDATGKLNFRLHDPHVHIYLPFMEPSRRTITPLAASVALMGGTTTLDRNAAPPQRRSCEAIRLWKSSRRDCPRLHRFWPWASRAFDEGDGEALRAIVAEGGHHVVQGSFVAEGARSASRIPNLPDAGAGQGTGVVTAHCENADLVSQRK
jgi:dihydropyrimidinase